MRRHDTYCSNFSCTDKADAQEKASEPTNVNLTVSGPPEDQVLLIKSNHSLSLTQLDFLISTEACICSRSISEDGNELSVRLDHTKAAELFGAPRSDRNPSDFSGPAKLRLVFSVGNRQRQVTLPVMLVARSLKGKQWIAITGSAAFEITP